MEMTQIHQEENPADAIWAILRENAQQLKELRKTQKEDARRLDKQMKETDRRMQETDRQMKETSRRIKETDRQMKETDRQIKEANKRFGEFTNRFGEMVEYMVIPNLLTKFEELGFTFTKANRTEIKDREHKIFIEVDAFLENGDKVMIVEIKSKPRVDDIDGHIERMEKLRVYADLRNDKRVYLGAMAGVVFSESAKIYALKNGFFVIEPSGDTFHITAPEGEYHPHEW
jgi:exonuclease VII large subunit